MRWYAFRIYLLQVGKRVVLVHPDGVRQILGVVEGELSVTAGPLQERGRDIPFVSLVRVTTRAAYYKEPLVPASYTFHDRQL